jgi:hypothetical protein
MRRLYPNGIRACAAFVAGWGMAVWGRSGCALADSVPVINPDFNQVYEVGDPSVTGTLNPGASGGTWTLASLSFANPADVPFVASGSGAPSVFFSFATDSSVTDAGVPGWGRIGPGTGTFDGIQEIGSDLVAPSPAGSVWGYVAVPGDGLSQTLSTDLAADTSYTLSFYVGNRNDGQGGDLLPGTYGELSAGGTPLTGTFSGANPASGSFGLWSYTFATGDNPTGLNDPLVITLGVSSGELQPQFNGVSLTETAIPEPGAAYGAVALLLGLGASRFGRRLVVNR